MFHLIVSGLGRGEWQCLGRASLRRPPRRHERAPSLAPRAVRLPRAVYAVACLVRAFCNMDKKQCLQLIQLYSKNRDLWDSTLPDYRNRDLRDEIWRKISLEMGISSMKLKKKMASLLGAHRRELSREKQRSSSM